MPAGTLAVETAPVFINFDSKPWISEGDTGQRSHERLQAFFLQTGTYMAETANRMLAQSPNKDTVLW